MRSVGNTTRALKQRVGRAVRLSQNEEAYNTLKQKITTLAYKPGESINITTLMHNLSLGRTPINHALHRLSAEGLVNILPRKGVMIAPLSIDNALEIIEVRIANESLCTKLAAQKIQAHEVVALEALLDTFEHSIATHDMVLAIDTDRLFHEKIALISGNTLLFDFLKVIHALSQRFWASSLSSAKHLQEVVIEHRSIVKALANHDATEAVAAVEAHIRSFQRALLNP